MAADSTKVLAGIAGGGAGQDLAWIAPTGTALPGTAVASLNAAFKSGGWISTDGLTAGVNESITDLGGFGSTGVVRTFVTQSKRTFKLTFLESNVVSLAVYHRLPLASVTAGAGTGIIDITTGAPTATRWAAVFDVVDGSNLLRAACPLVQNTTITDLSIKNSEAIEYSVELTAYPDSSGNSIYWHYVVPTAG